MIFFSELDEGYRFLYEKEVQTSSPTERRQID